LLSQAGHTTQGAAASGSQRGPREAAGQWAVAIHNHHSAVVLSSPEASGTAMYDLLLAAEMARTQAQGLGCIVHCIHVVLNALLFM